MELKTPRHLIHQSDLTKLYEYPSHQAAWASVLIVFATINRPEILDLYPERSFIKDLTQAGITVYLLDWGYPSPDDSHLSLAHYLEYMDQHVRFILTKTKKTKLTLLGICQGGILSTCYAAASSSIHKLILISTPIDFHTPGDLVQKQLSNHFSLPTKQNIPGLSLTHFFMSLQPQKIRDKYQHFLKNINNPSATEKFLQVERWLYDTPNQPYTAFKQLVEWFYLENKLIKKEVMLNKQNISLEQIRAPILNIVARYDHIVPIKASLALKKWVRVPVTQRIINTGHIGLYISEEHGMKTPKAIVKWLKSSF